MQVQRIIIKKGSEEHSTWQVLRSNHLPLVPVNKFLSYMENTGKSPNTIKSYAHHLKQFFIFLEYKQLNWKEINFSALAEFTSYLKIPKEEAVKLSGSTSRNVIAFPQTASPVRRTKPSRSNNTINVMLAAVCSFYEYQSRLCELPSLSIYQLTRPVGSTRYKPFLHNLAPGRGLFLNKLKLKPKQKLPKLISPGEFKELIAACNHLRDKFMLCLLYETGMRIGQALGLRHEDIRTFDNEIIIKPRDFNVNNSRAKTGDAYTICVSEQLMRIYTDYLIEECGDIESDYVFVNLWCEPLGRPMSYPSVVDLFRRLNKKTKINVRPHMFRHTHATDMIRATGRPDLVSRRLGHKSVQTTLKFYAHLDDRDLKEAYQTYTKKREVNDNESIENS